MAPFRPGRSEGVATGDKVSQGLLLSYCWGGMISLSVREYASLCRIACCVNGEALPGSQTADLMGATQTELQNEFGDYHGCCLVTSSTAER
jgi:hypothetical protein